MKKAIFYKEWIKTRWFFAITAFVSVVLSGYTVLNVGRIVELKGAAHIWEVVLQRDAIFIQLMNFVPLIIGLLTGVFQFVPEIQLKRLKLTLHLPCSYYKSIGTMLIFSAGVLLVIFLINFAIFYLGLNSIFAIEIIKHILLTALPWYVAGWMAYALTAWVFIEPTWKRKIPNLLIAIALLRVFFMSDKPEAYNSFLLILSVFTVLAFSLPFLSVERFKIGKQD